MVGPNSPHVNSLNSDMMLVVSSHISGEVVSLPSYVSKATLGLLYSNATGSQSTTSILTGTSEHNPANSSDADGRRPPGVSVCDVRGFPLTPV